MNIIFVQPYGHLEGHYSSYTRLLMIEGMVKLGHQVNVVTWDGLLDYKESCETIKVHECKKLFFFRLILLLFDCFPNGFKRIALTLITGLYAQNLKRNGYGKHIHFIDCEYLGVWLGLFLKLLRLPLTLTVIESRFSHGETFLNKWRTTANLFALKKLGGKQIKFIAHSLSVEKEFIESDYVANHKITTIPWGISFEQEIIDKDISKKKLNIDTNIPILLYFGVLRKNKGIDLMLSELVNAPKEFFILIAGPDPHKHGPQLIDPFFGNGWEHNIMVNLGFVDNDKVKYYFGAADAVLLPYNVEFNQASGVLSVAIGYQKMLISTNAGQIGDIVKKNEIGIVFDVEKKGEFKKAVHRFCSNKERYLKTFEQKLPNLIEKYNWASIAQKHVDEYPVKNWGCQP